ncbi:MAG: aspartate ammonia-lyase [Elusimicrobiales bacterium]
MELRVEKDSLGGINVPEHAYWGAHTQRALDNFRLSGQKVSPALIKALAMVKKAAAQANKELEFLDAEKAGAIITACGEIIDGKFANQFPLDALQGGAGTSANMNVNEVIANRGIELLGGKRGDYAVIHPLEHVNLHQSTNDVYPTALKIACVYKVRALSEAAARLQGAFQSGEAKFARVVKTGRTEMQPAVPMTLGAEFSAWAEALSRDRWRAFKCEERLRVVNLGGTAIGTGLGAPRDYIFLVLEKLRQTAGLGLSRGENLPGETANSDVFVEVSGILKAHATTLAKICGDLRLLNLLGEIKLPPVQVGSSIMPGKYNPVICEAATQCALKAMANDALVAECASRASLQINEFLPLLAHSILESLDILSAADTALEPHVKAISADEKTCLANCSSPTALITPFLPHVGYRKALELLQGFEAEGGGDFRGYLAKKLGAELVERVLSPESLTALGHKNAKNT